MEVNVKSIGRQQFVVEHKGVEWFQSYGVVVAERGYDGVVKLDKKYWNFSKTTMRYLAVFLKMKSKDIIQNVSRGTFKLIDLNSKG